MELSEIRKLTPATGGYEYRRGYIAVTDSSSSAMCCLACGTSWLAMLRHGGYFYRGAWTCYYCGANSKGEFRK